MLKPDYRPLDDHARARNIKDLRDRGYSDREITEILRRAEHYLEHVLDFGSARENYNFEYSRRDLRTAITEVLCDSVDIAIGRFR